MRICKWRILQVVPRRLVTLPVLIRKSNQDVRTELSELWVPVQEPLPEYQFMRSGWSHENRNLVETALRVTIQATKDEIPGISESTWAFQREVALAGAGLIDGIAAWSSIHAWSHVPCWRMRVRRGSSMRYLRAHVTTVVLKPLPASLNIIVRTLAHSAGSASWNFGITSI